MNKNHQSDSTLETETETETEKKKQITKYLLEYEQCEYVNKR